VRRRRPTADRLAALRGCTAVVTGASSGIGAAFCRALAAEGLAVVGVARRAPELGAVVAEVEAAGGRGEALVADLATSEGRDRVGERIEGDDVALLVNNAGVATHGRFADVPVEDSLAMVELNVSTVVALSKRAVDAFVARGGGALLNVASTSAYKPMAELVVYGSAKAFVRGFSLGLRQEVRPSGVDVCVVAPGPVRTAMLEEALGRPIAPASAIGRLLERTYFMDAHECVRRSLEGVRRGRAEVVVDPIDRAVVRLPHGLLERVDAWSLRHLTGGR
jgi:short-subunit dehydrogenase